MGRLRRALLVGLVLTGVFVLGGQSAAHACSCAPATPAEQMAEADAVFTGELTSVTPVRVDDIGLYEHAFRFDVDEVFGGSVGPTAEVLSTLGGTGCGLDAQVGQRWVVVASREVSHPEDLTTGYCTETRIIGEATPRFVGEGHPPDPSIPAPRDRTVDTRVATGQLVALGLLLAIGVVAGAMALGRRPVLAEAVPARSAAQAPG